VAPGNLPAESSRFFGRARDLEQVAARLRRERLVTLTGTGGVGKTRLARRVATIAWRSGQYPGGVWLVDLAALTEPHLVGQVVAGTLNASDRAGADVETALVQRVMGGPAVLLLLDNCEHVAPACAGLVSSLLACAPELHVMATSREPLRADGENVIVVSPLEAPDPDEVGDEPGRGGDALDLFVDRAAAAAGFAVTPENRAAALRLCHRLDGLPLAIELAAAFLRALSLDQLLDVVSDRLHILDGTVGPRRHRTLHAAIEWSHDLCVPAEQVLWSRLSVFVGPFDLAAAEHVGGNGAATDEPSVLVALVGLVDKSVLAVETDGVDSTSRYRMLETIRQYGHRRLDRTGSADETRRRHLSWYRDLARRFEAESCSVDQLDWARRFQREQPNLRAALDFAINDPEHGHDALDLCVNLRSYWIVRSRLGEGRYWLDQALAACPAPSRARSTAQWVSAALAVLQGDLPAARDRLDRGFTLARSLGDDDALAYLTYVDGAASLVAGDPQAALTSLLRAETMLRTVRHLDVMALSIGFMLGLTHLLLGEPDRALAQCDHGGRVSEARGERWAHANTLWVSALAWWAKAETEIAVEHARRCLAVKHALDDPLGITITLEQLAWFAGSLGHHTISAELLGATDKLWTRVGRPWFGLEALTVFRHDCEDSARRHLGDKRFLAAQERGRRLTIDEAVALAHASAV
jgi:non-specific serine/threonine protein kinase